MASKAGRNNNTWKTPVKLTMKVCLGKWRQELYDQGLRGNNLEEQTAKKFWDHFSGAQFYFDHPLTTKAIACRGMWDVETKRTENPYTNPTMRPYVAAAEEIIRLRKLGLPSKSNEELTNFCSSYRPIQQKEKIRRRNISSRVREEHIKIVNSLGGMCPCCGFERIVGENGNKIAGEFDHFYSNQLPNFEHSWLICKECHDKFTYNQTTRTDYRYCFDIYQQRAHLKISGEKIA